MDIREFYVIDAEGKQKKAAEIRCTTDGFASVDATGYCSGHTTCYIYKGANKGNIYVWDGANWELQNS